jgi:hypothetical protein
MKKTSLVLAISALLYGTSSTYVLAEPTDQQILDYLDNTTENASALDVPAGFDPSQALPLHVAVAGSDEPIILDPHFRMCRNSVNGSFAVNGAAMAEFPVTVDGELGTWGVEGNKTVVTGDGWKLTLPNGDTWNATWTLTVTAGTVESILFKPFERDEPDQMKYAFDIGGKLPRFPAPRPDYEHTPDAARGQFIVQRTPGTPPPIFTATYSYPIYTTHVGGHGAADLDSTDIPLNVAGNRKPTHDLYSTLEINFPNGGLTGAVAIDPGFGFVADTDCLPVEAVAINSYENGILDFTVAGDGAVEIIKDGNPTGQKFDVSRDIDGGIKNFQIPFVPQAGSCYYMRDENTGNAMTQNYCF